LKKDAAECCFDHKIDYINCKLNDEPWVRQSCCEREYIRQTRTPGLFKEEFSGSKFVALSPNVTSHSMMTNLKYLLKVLQKTINYNTKILKRLSTGQNQKKTCINRGFTSSKGVVKTYQQVKTGLSYLYFKRIVEADGVSTRPLLL